MAYRSNSNKKISDFDAEFWNLAPNSTEADVDRVRDEHAQRRIFTDEPDSYRNHKYLYKYETDSGKIRYVYETKNGKRRSYGKNSIQNQSAYDSGGTQYRSNRYLEKRNNRVDIVRDNVNTVIEQLGRGNLPKAADYVSRVARDIPTLAGYAGDQVYDSVRSGFDFIASLLK